ncbi:hypothetical protein [Streptomyces orinoci]|uniref:DUF7848 domain-containing protein n=1 Tax=Streptomyces orinoci TaxID=67339 RepID=A0ABV3JVY6_STRON|nr:hypothetical protein [Streptomyces orinoci]
MTRTTFRFARWRIMSTKVPGTPLVSHELECMGCGERSGMHPEFERCRDWAFSHSGRNQQHGGTYREIVHRYWTADLID